jgi:hypothetical protein
MAEKQRNEVEELAQKARTKAAQHSARMNKQALKLIASQARVERIRPTTRRGLRGRKRLLKEREREKKLGLPSPLQTRGNKRK